MMWKPFPYSSAYAETGEESRKEGRGARLKLKVKAPVPVPETRKQRVRQTKRGGPPVGNDSSQGQDIGPVNPSRRITRTIKTEPIEHHPQRAAAQSIKEEAEVIGTISRPPGRVRTKKQT